MSTVDTTGENVDKEALEAQKKAEQVAYFINEIAAAAKREKDFRKEGHRILDLYTGKKSNPFAILYSNTETLLPALYSAVPRPVVQRRFKDEDPLGKIAAQAGQRVLEFLLDTNTEGYETFDTAVRTAVLDGLLPGRGVTGVKYEADVQDVVPDGSPEDAEPVPVKNWETVCPDSISWDRFLHGYARKWSKVPWIAYELHLDRDESEKRFGPEITAKITFTEGEQESSEDDAAENEKTEEERNLGERKTALFWQVWDKDGGRKIRYICPQYKDDFCKVEDDPLGLTGFFNCPRPIQFLEKSNDLIPVALYCLYEQQATELNNLTTRIKKVIAAIKARALYDTELGDDLKSLMEADEPAMVPADKSSSLAAEKGLDNAVWFWPVEKLIVVLRELYAAREACKQVIYEITGIADIMRGQTNASETLGAQEIKQQWGTLRLKRLQKEVQRYARDLLRMMLEIAAKKFSESTWAQMTGLPFITTEKRQEAMSIAQAAQMSGQPVDPQIQAALQAPTWEQVLDTLRNDTQRAYRIDIETNSTVEPEAVEDQKMIAEVMNALAQYLNGVAPLVVNGSMPFEAAQSMLLAIIRRFRFGPELEDHVKAMKAPQPPDDGKAEAERAKLEMEREKHGFEMEQKKADGDIKAGLAKLEAQIKERELQMKMRELDRKEQFAEKQFMLKMRTLEAQVAAAHAMPKDKAKPAAKETA
jgi:hypothetical protein